MERALGNDPHSGNGDLTKSAKRRKRKKKRDADAQEAGSNGKTDWKAVAVKAQEELSTLKEQVQQLEEGLKHHRAKYTSLRKRYETVSAAAMDEKAATKLRILLSLWGNMVNFQARCREDRKRIDELVDAYMPALKRGVEEASKPL